MSIDLSKLSVAELKTLARNVEKAIVANDARRRKKARAAMEKAAKEFGLSVEDILTEEAPKAKRAYKKKPGPKPGKAKPKYRNPDDAKQTWSGRGRRPAWFIAATSAGKSPEELEI